VHPLVLRLVISEPVYQRITQLGQPLHASVTHVDPIPVLISSLEQHVVLPLQKIHPQHEVPHRVAVVLAVEVNSPPIHPDLLAATVLSHIGILTLFLADIGSSAFLDAPIPRAVIVTPETYLGLLLSTSGESHALLGSFDGTLGGPRKMTTESPWRRHLADPDMNSVKLSTPTAAYTAPKKIPCGSCSR